MDEKKDQELPVLSTTLLPPEPNTPEDFVLELDEVWSFVAKKTNACWVWIALCRATRQVVAYAVGDRSAQTCLRLWMAVPLMYKQSTWYSDFWKAYHAIIPDHLHIAVGKETGETAHVERWNNTLRQRLGRFVRKTLSFSKSLRMHEIALRFFLHRYNLEIAIPRK